MSNSKVQQTNRRQFFVGAAAVAGTAVVLSKTPVGKKVIAEVEESISPEKKGYQLTEHVQKYYKTTLD